MATTLQTFADGALGYESVGPTENILEEARGLASHYRNHPDTEYEEIYQFVDSHGWEIEFRNQEDGGSVFLRVELERETA